MAGFENKRPLLPRPTTYVEGWFIAEEAAPSYARHLTFCMDVGLVERARQISSVLSRDNLKCLTGVQEAVEETLEWLVEAEAFEQLHGKGSKLNRNHPKWASAREGMRTSTPV